MIKCPKCHQPLNRFKLLFKSNYSTIKCSNCGKTSKIRRLGGTMFGAIMGGVTPILCMIMGRLFEMPTALFGLLMLLIVQLGIIYFYDEKYFEIMYE